MTIPDGLGGGDEMRYPATGTTNPVVKIGCLEIKLGKVRSDEDRSNEVTMQSQAATNPTPRIHSCKTRVIRNYLQAYFSPIIPTHFSVVPLRSSQEKESWERVKWVELPGGMEYAARVNTWNGGVFVQWQDRRQGKVRQIEELQPSLRLIF